MTKLYCRLLAWHSHRKSLPSAFESLRLSHTISGIVSWRLSSGSVTRIEQLPRVMESVTRLIASSTHS
ncbi:hypothetical protein J6590_029799 [Homalodisca vitripennis]|nr:hypothetical protein J6590_029799 [Homalodisca vitripennis]